VRLPNGDQAIVDSEKIRGYLLSPSHPVGRFKSVFFGALGYSVNQWEVLRDDLLDVARTADAESGQSSRFGQKYETRATLAGPKGRSAPIVVVWVVRTGESVPRFVTAFPG
jgi:hypothetical protein